MRNDFESLICWLDHWLSCMLDCIYVCVFLLLKNCFEKLARHLLDTYICRRAFSQHLPRQMAQHLSTPYLSRFTKDLFKLPHAIRSSFLSISLSIALCFLSQTLSSHSNLVSQGFFKIFQDFILLVSFYSLILHAFHVLKPRFWGFFWKSLGFFKIDELLLQFWVGLC